MYVSIALLRPLAGSSYIKAPPSLVSKKAVVNVEHYDNECFNWAISSVLFVDDTNIKRTSSYVQ